MDFVAKSAPNINGLKDKRDKGFNKIEIQLISEEITNSYDTITSIENIDIVGVHTPLINSNNKNYDIDIAYLSNKQYNNILLKTCELAQQLAEEYGHNVYVVIHNSLSAYDLDKMNILVYYIIELFGKILYRFPNIDVYIENVTPLTYDDLFRNGVFLSDTKCLVDLLNRNCGNRFAITYDTCHNMITKKIYNNILNGNEKLSVKDYIPKDLSNEFIFSKYSNDIKNIHLNNIINYGSSSKTHGTSFLDCEKDINYLKDFFDNYNKYKCKAYITLEIREQDYSNSINALNTFNLIKNILNMK